MRIPEKTVQEILRRVRIEDIVGEYVQLSPKGDRLWGLSPFKTEKTPSFTVSPDKGVYYCFSTQKGGSVVNFLMEKDNLSFPEALAYLAKKVGIDITADEGEYTEEYKNKSALEELYRRLTQTFQHFLLKTENGKIGLDYLMERRGLPLSIIEDFQLGYVPADPFWLHRFLIEKKYDHEFLAKSGLFGGKSKDWCLFSGRAIFPIANLSGETIAFGGRLLEGEGPKYINSPETVLFHKGTNLYALNKARDSIKKTGGAIICEGYMDVIALHTAGVTNAIAPLGTAFTADQAHLLKRFASDLSLLFDSDEAGIKATMKALGLATKAQLNLFVIQLPAGKKDPADILLESGSQELEKLVDCKIDAYNYLLKLVENQGSLIHTLGGREKAVQSFMPFWESVDEESKLLDALDRFSDLLGLERIAFRKDVFRRLKRAYGGNDRQFPGNGIQASTAPASASASNLDVRIMLTVFIHGRLFELLRNSIQMDDLMHPWAFELFVVLEEAFRDHEQDINAMIMKISIPELRQLISQKMVDGEFSGDPDTLVKDGIRRIKERNFSQRREQVDYQLRRLLLDPQHDPAVERELLEEKIILNAALKELRNHIDD